MKKLLMPLLVVVVVGSAAFALKAYTQNNNDSQANASKPATASIKAGDDIIAAKSTCPGHGECCGDSADCSGGCPDYSDANTDGKCDMKKSCHDASAHPGRYCHEKHGCDRHN